MGQKVHPVGFRLGVTKNWSSRWFARDRKSYANLLLEDLKIKNFVKKNLSGAEIADVEIEKTGESAKIILHSARPGVVIGKKGSEIETIRREISQLINRPVIDVSVQEVKNPELNAVLVAKSISEQLIKRVSYKNAMKKAIAAAARSGAKGIKICIAGRLAGAEIARTEWERFGSVPLHTLRADIDYGFAEALTTYGIIGVKVWICKGEVKKS